MSPRSSVAAHSARREAGHDGRPAVFLEFWTHVLRHGEHRARFASIHNRYFDVYAEAMERVAAERGVGLPFDARRLTVATTVMGTGLGLEAPDPARADRRRLRRSDAAAVDGLLVPQRRRR